MELVRVQAEDFSIEEEVARIKAKSKRIGGIATFLGTVRDFSRGQGVSKLFYEQYSGMALKELRALRTEAMKKFGLIEMLIVHRYGELAPGDNVVLILAASEHRVYALDACRWCIDELKRRVPIWKKEFSTSGATWVDEHP